MKTIKYFLLLALSLITCTVLTSCKDDANDWDNETGGVANRQWSPIGSSGSPGDTYVILSNFSVAGATGYVIQLAPTDDITIEPTDASFSTGVLERTIGAISSEAEYQFDGLTPETSYYLRIKATCAGKIDSNWYYLRKVSNDVMTYGFKTKKSGEEADSDEE
jgi:hypothetical protein